MSLRDSLNNPRRYMQTKRRNPLMILYNGTNIDFDRIDLKKCRRK